jgi:hypothetical protein
MKIKVEVEVPDELWKEFECEWCPFACVENLPAGGFRYRCKVRKSPGECPAKVVNEEG